VFYKEAKTTFRFLLRNETKQMTNKIPLLRIPSITYSIYYVFYLLRIQIQSNILRIVCHVPKPRHRKAL